MPKPLLKKSLIAAIAALCGAPHLHAKSGSGYTYYQKLTGEDSDSDKEYWDALHHGDKKNGTNPALGKQLSKFLLENLESLPLGHVLDLGMGEGSNAVYLAKKGFEVTGVDASEVAVRKARRLAHENNVRIRGVVAGRDRYKIGRSSYEVILALHGLERGALPKILAALKPGGVLVLEITDPNPLQRKRGVALKRNQLILAAEVKPALRALKEVKYREFKDERGQGVQMIARKPPEKPIKKK